MIVIGEFQMIEKTLVFFKPDAIERNIVNDIFEKYIVGNGFKVVSLKPEIVTKEKILMHYKDNLKDKTLDIINRVIDFYNGKLIIILILEKENAILEFRNILGASDPIMANKNTIRGEYANDSYYIAEHEKRSCRNIMHASDSKSSFKYEFSIWFNK